MSQLVFKFPFKTKYFEQDFYVSSNNFSAYKIIESWPKWNEKWLNIFGVPGSGKTHLSKILEKKINKIQIVEAKKINDNTILNLNNLECLIIDNFNNNINENEGMTTLKNIHNSSPEHKKMEILNNLEKREDEDDKTCRKIKDTYDKECKSIKDKFNCNTKYCCIWSKMDNGFQCVGGNENGAFQGSSDEYYYRNKLMIK